MEVQVSIRDKDRKVGAMVKALAFEIDGPKSVKGSTKDVLAAEGYYTFHFSSDEKVNEFKQALALYLPGYLAEVSD